MNELDLMFFGRIIFATVCSFIIGFERKRQQKEAGVKTHCIVGMASALIMIISKYGFGDVGGADGGRIAAQIVSGVGFLGAGMIFVKNQSVSGLTTAAGIWATAAVGMAIGSGMYWVGAATTILIIVLHWLTHFMEKSITEHIHIEMTKNRTNEILTITEKSKIQNFSIESKDNLIIIDMVVNFVSEKQKHDWAAQILSLDTNIRISF